jgi:hypothetical protein
MEHKKRRQLALGANARLYFEDEMTIRYQIQEMLRIEKVFEADAINEEIEAYNPLIPDGGNWKATFMLEYEDPAEREKQLSLLIGIEDKVWLQIGGCDKVYPIADEDLERQNGSKTSSVHFLRFELTPSMITAMHNNASLTAGIEHTAYPLEAISVPADITDSLRADLEQVMLN